MGFLVSIFYFFRNIVVAKRKLKNGIQLKINYKKIVGKTVVLYVGIVFAILIFIGALVYNVTYSVKDALNYLNSKYNTTNIDELYNSISNMSEDDIKAFKDQFPFLDPTKILLYIDKQRESVPSSISGTKTTIEDGNTSKEEVTVDVNKLSSQYILPWQLVSAMDLITMKAMEKDNTSVIDASNYANSQFKWADDVTRDDTHYWKDWTVETRSDDGGTEVIYDGEDTAPEHYKTVKTPLGLADSVNTMFGLYKYDIKRDVLLVDESYSARQLLKAESHSETHHHDTDGDGEDDDSETVTYTTYYYTKTRNKLVEDQALGPTFTFDPTNFIRFLNAAKYKIADLKLLKLTLEALPNTTNILDMIDRIIEGNYGDLNTDINYSGGGLTIGGSSFIPLFHQWDEKWGSIPYGSEGTIATSACGPTSMAMVITGLQGKMDGLDLSNDGIVDPAEAASYSVSHGYRVLGQGTGWGYFADIGHKADLNVRQYSTSDYQQVYEELKNGNPVIASMGPGHFTSAGHFIVLVGVLPDGRIKVNDPNRQICSDTPWDFTSIIVPEALQFWAFDNPNRKSVTFEATAYTGAADEGEGQGITRDGTNIFGKDLRDKLIAVDTDIIPLGSIVYIEVPPASRYQTMPDGTVVDMNGYYRACDTGSAIKGHIIDLYFGTGSGYKELCANSWGRQNVQVYLK